MVVPLDPDGIVLRANRVVEHGGSMVSGVIGKSVHSVLHPECSDAICEVARGCVRHSSSWRNGFPPGVRVYTSIPIGRCSTCCVRCAPARTRGSASGCTQCAGGHRCVRAAPRPAGSREPQSGLGVARAASHPELYDSNANCAMKSPGASMRTRTPRLAQQSGAFSEQ